MNGFENQILFGNAYNQILFRQCKPTNTCTLAVIPHFSETKIISQANSFDVTKSGPFIYIWLDSM
jgi:hypothetical protein